MTAADPIFDRATVTELPNGVIAYRASSFGYCIGALVRARLGMTPSPPPDVMLERYQEGHDWEREVLAAGLGVDWIEETKDSVLGRYGFVVEGRNGERQVETELAWGNKAVTCHPDAIVQHGTSKAYRVAEVKFLGAEMFNRIIGQVEKDGQLGLGSGYAWQASIEMLTTGLPMLYIIGQKDIREKVVDGVKVREVVGLAGPPVVYEFDAPAHSLRDVKMRVAEVEGWVARGEMPPCVVPFDYPCGYWAEHDQGDKPPPITEPGMVHLVESYARNRAKAEAIETEAREIRKDIDARLYEMLLDGGECAGWEIARTKARPGNVSWSAAWKSLPADVRKGVDVEKYRGKDVEAGIRLTKIKDKGDEDGR